MKSCKRKEFGKELRGGKGSTQGRRMKWGFEKQGFRGGARWKKSIKRSNDLLLPPHTSAYRPAAEPTHARPRSLGQTVLKRAEGGRDIGVVRNQH